MQIFGELFLQNTNSAPEIRGLRVSEIVSQQLKTIKNYYDEFIKSTTAHNYQQLHRLAVVSVVMQIAACDAAGACYIIIACAHVPIHIAVCFLDELPLLIIDADNGVMLVLDNYTVDIIEPDYMFVGFLALHCVRSEDVGLIIVD